MSYKQRQILASAMGVLIAAAALGGGIYFATKHSNSSGNPTSTITAPTTTYVQPGGPIVTTPTVTGPAKPGQGRTFTLKVKVGSPQYFSDSSMEELRFTVRHYKARVRSQVARVGETLDEVAGIYGDVASAKKLTIGGKPAYLFADKAGAWTSIIAVTEKKGRDYFLQISVPTKKRALGEQTLEQLGHKIILG